jgi:hypothetical protein
VVSLCEEVTSGSAGWLPRVPCVVTGMQWAQVSREIVLMVVSQAAVT